MVTYIFDLNFYLLQKTLEFWYFPNKSFNFFFFLFFWNNKPIQIFSILWQLYLLVFLQIVLLHTSFPLLKKYFISISFYFQVFFRAPFIIKSLHNNGIFSKIIFIKSKFTSWNKYRWTLFNFFFKFHHLINFLV